MMYKKFSPNQKIKVVTFCINNNNDFNLTQRSLEYLILLYIIELNCTKQTVEIALILKKNKLTKDDKKIFDAAARAEIMEVYELF